MKSDRWKAKPTPYSGNLFRSATEAAWAAFFDKLKTPWVYEPQLCNLADGLWYTPDFWLPEVNDGCFIEIKGHESQIDSTVEEKCTRLAQLTGYPVFLFVGRWHLTRWYGVVDEWYYNDLPSDDEGGWRYDSGGGCDNHMCFGHCDVKNEVSISFEARHKCEHPGERCLGLRVQAPELLTHAL